MLLKRTVSTCQKKPSLYKWLGHAHKAQDIKLNELKLFAAEGQLNKDSRTSAGNGNGGWWLFRWASGRGS